MPSELPPPPNADAVLPVVAGTVVWVVALVVGLVLDLNTPWVAVCATATGLGLIGTLIVLRRRAAYHRAGRSASGQG